MIWQRVAKKEANYTTTVVAAGVDPVDPSGVEGRKFFVVVRRSHLFPSHSFSSLLFSSLLHLSRFVPDRSFVFAFLFCWVG